MKIKLALATLFLSMLISCNFSYKSDFSNRIEEKIEAEELIKQFYDLQKSGKNEKVMQFFEDTLSVKNKEKILNSFNENKKQFGYLQEYTLEKYESRVIQVMMNSSSEYHFTYFNRYERAQTRETIDLIKKDGGKITIAEYKITRLK